MGWSGIATWSFIMSIFLLVKNAIVITVFIIKRFIDNFDKPTMRPATDGRGISKIERETSVNIKNYLMDPNDEGIDEDGNTSIH